MKNKRNSVAKILGLKGYLTPTNEEELKAFEKRFEKSYEEPEKWDNPLEILKKGKVKKIKIESLKFYSTQETGNLSMAARDGKEISKEVKDKMKKDRSNGERKK